MSYCHYLVEPYYHLGTTCAAAWHLVKTYPSVPICFGFSVACAVFAMRVSTSSPRWKGAPILVEPSQKDVDCAFALDELYKDVDFAVATYTVTTSTTDENLLLALSNNDIELLHLAVDNVDAVLSFLRSSQQHCHSFYGRFCCAQCKRGFTTFYYLGDPTTLLSNVFEEKLLCDAENINYTGRHFCKRFTNCDCCSNSSSASGGECAFGASLVCFSESKACQTKRAMLALSQCDNSDVIMPKVVLDHSHIFKHDCDFLASKKLVEFTSLNGGVEFNGNSKVELTRKFPSTSEEKTPKQNLQQSLTFQSDDGSRNRLARLGHRHIFNQNFFFWPVQRPTCISIEFTAWVKTFYNMLKSAGKCRLEKRVACSVVSCENDISTTFCAAGDNQKDKCDNERKWQELSTRLPSLEEQLLSLKTRHERQLRLSIGSLYAEGSEKFCDDGRSAEGAQQPATQVFNTPLAGSLEKTPQTLCSSQSKQSTESTEYVDWTDSSGTQQNDRRIDDVFVRHRSDCTAPYSLSLTYNDAHGSSRTIDTQKLPPLKLSPRSLATSQRGAVVADASTVRGQSLKPLCLREAVPRDASHLDAAQVSGGLKVSRGLFVAPLPPLGFAKGSLLQDIGCMSGKFCIGAFLGGGGCGKVYECLNTETGEVFAVKQVLFDPKDPKLRSRLRQLKLEKEVLTLAAHHCMPWIVGFHGAEKHGHSALMFLEYCAKGSLLDYMLSRGAKTPFQQQQEPVNVVSATGIACVEQSNSSTLASDGKLFHQDAEKEKFAEWGDGGSGGAAVKVLPRGDSASSSFTAASALNKKEVVAEMPPFPINEVRRFTRQIVEALYFLHFHGYAHLDVKTANVLVTEEGSTRLADFGCSMHLRQNMPSCSLCELATQNTDDLIDETVTPAAAIITTAADNSSSSSSSGGARSSDKHDAIALPYPVLDKTDTITEFRGTALYIAPEMVRFERGYIGTASDVWSLGCVVMELATGAAPWRHLTADKLRVLYFVASAREELPLPPSVLRAAEEAALWLSTHAAGETVDCDKAVEVAHKRRCLESELCQDGAALCECKEKDNSEHRKQMHLWVALKDFLSLCLRVRPEERPSCEDLLHHSFLSFN